MRARAWLLVGVLSCAAAPAAQRVNLVDPSHGASTSSSASPGAPTDFVVSVRSAQDGAPLAGAEILLETAEQPERGSRSECGNDTLDASPPSTLGPGPGRYEISKSTDARGEVTFTPAELRAIEPPTSSCPPGAPCMPPPMYRSSMHVRKPGFLPVVGHDLGVRAVRLVPASAKIDSNAAAISAVEAQPALQPWLAAMPYKTRAACLTRAGSWKVVFPAVSWVPIPPPQSSTWYDRPPGYLPGVDATVDPLTAAVTVTSCPGQGTPVRLVSRDAARVVLTDLVTGYEYACPSLGCMDTVQPGSRLVLVSYAAPANGCGAPSAASMGIVAGVGPRTTCHLQGCTRVR